LSGPPYGCGAYDVITKQEEILDFFKRSSLLEKADCLDEAHCLRFNDNKLSFLDAWDHLTVMWRMVPRNPGLTLKLWDAEDFVDNLLTKDMLPISREYALHV
jgi:hypothetical protein